MALFPLKPTPCCCIATAWRNFNGAYCRSIYLCILRRWTLYVSQTYTKSPVGVCSYSSRLCIVVCFQVTASPPPPYLDDRHRIVEEILVVGCVERTRYYALPPNNPLKLKNKNIHRFLPSAWKARYNSMLGSVRGRRLFFRKCQGKTVVSFFHI